MYLRQQSVIIQALNLHFPPFSEVVKSLLPTPLPPLSLFSTAFVNSMWTLICTPLIGSKCGDIKSPQANMQRTYLGRDSNARALLMLRRIRCSPLDFGALHLLIRLFQASRHLTHSAGLLPALKLKANSDINFLSMRPCRVL